MGGPNAGEPSVRERIKRAKTLTRRALGYWKMSLFLLVLGLGIATAVAMQVKRVYRSEATVLVKRGISTNDRDESPEQMVAKLKARLNDMLHTRSRLEGAIRKFHLYPKTVESKGYLDAAEEMKPHVGLRASEGGQYIISFDGEDRDTVQQVTQYLAESLRDEYTRGNLGDLKQESDFLEEQEKAAEAELERTTKALTVFLAAHPEFSLEAKAAATPFPAAFGPNPTAGIPLMPKLKDGKDAMPAGITDPELAALYRQKARLEQEVRAASAPAGAAVPPAGATKADAHAQAQADVEAATKRVAETQADIVAKSNLTEDHPDMKAARAAAGTAAAQLHQARARLAALQQQAPTPVDPTQVNPELADKLKQINAQIAARQAQIAGKHPTPAPSASGSAAASAAAPEVAANPIVALETEWQRLLRGMSEAKARQTDIKVRAERARLSVAAAQVTANELMSIIEAAPRPTRPIKGRGNAAMIGCALALIVSCFTWRPEWCSTTRLSIRRTSRR
jgi:hypothetical protein